MEEVPISTTSGCHSFVPVLTWSIGRRKVLLILWDNEQHSHCLLSVTGQMMTDKSSIGLPRRMPWVSYKHAYMHTIDKCNHQDHAYSSWSAGAPPRTLCSMIRYHIGPCNSTTTGHAIAFNQIHTFRDDPVTI